MITIENCGWVDGCPFCQAPLVEGTCSCGADIALRNMTAETLQDGEELSLKEAEEAVAFTVKVMDRVRKLAPLKRGAAKIGLVEINREYYMVTAKK